MPPPSALKLSAMKLSWACIEPPMRHKIRAAKAAKMKQMPVCFSPRRRYLPWWGIPFWLSLFFRTMTGSKMVDWRPWRPLTRENEMDHNFCGLREKMKTGRSVWHGSQRPLKMSQWGPYPTWATGTTIVSTYYIAGFCHRIRLGCLILLIAGATTISQKYGATSIPSNLVSTWYVVSRAD